MSCHGSPEFGKKEDSDSLERREKVRLESCHVTLNPCG